mmetsp:Transcript_10674/g.25694  ORF Transcript_10674/g.25694 Transcript_10674/m.25694 type:complete len:489 (-) Transcript_10674:123-1589(-)|eukprot:CAMPEP_0197182298 /NCGR_PEP_ID=MMETSP1423-20130617/6304_1 /TAXON_ID=476441 /ORGANISM="Pseudo-nitzschia heimii, Strain UNC1101" /LENGTH=488 /DNA_ID=CAMNT_0042632703 /DNA_START=40 /DNA_END=1509 /DNA_ORIENTATION=-
MILTTVLFREAKRSASNASRRSIKSLALSVYFKQPDLGMKDYEILSRASAFLLAVDPAPASGESDGPYAHLAKNERDRTLKLHKQASKYTPAGHPGDQRTLDQLGWLEFAPREVRPMVHCVCSSHVLAPYLWKDYYPQDWLKKVRQEHCAYSLEVFDNDPETMKTVSLGKFALNPYPIHHPEGKDIALIHLKQEDQTLKMLTEDLGLEILRLRDLDEIYDKGDEVAFDGYVVAEVNQADSETFEGRKCSNASQETFVDDNASTDNNGENDDRVFYPYNESGKLSFHTRDRFFATTPEPLPEGLCGGPVLDSNEMVCGIVEGIVSKDHKNKDIAGSAALMPNYVMALFIDYAERFMLQKILPKTLFQKAVTAKTTGQLGSGIFQKDEHGNMQPSGNSLTYEEAFDRAVDQLKENHTEEEVNAILNTVQRERKEVLEIMDKEGGDLDEIAERVRARTLHVREMIHEEYRKGVLENEDSSIIDAEVVEQKR